MLDELNCLLNASDVPMEPLHLPQNGDITNHRPTLAGRESAVPSRARNGLSTSPTPSTEKDGRPTMAQSGNAQTAIADATGLREVLARFQEALPHVVAWQIVTTILPLITLLVAMHAGLAFGWWPLLALGVPAAALTVRTFIIQHDCGHRSFCRARGANDLLGRLCSLLTLTPYSQWRRHHAKHHGAWNDLDRRGAHGRDIYSSCLTVAEYNALGTWRRRLHRTAKHPAISLLVLPPLIFLVLYRFPFAAPRTWRAERRSVHLTNLSLVALYGALTAMLGVGPVAGGAARRHGACEHCRCLAIFAAAPIRWDALDTTRAVGLG
jgi:fatty acid desaturase